MSSKKTQHYSLHSWEPEDSFLRTEFNENFDKLDGALPALKAELTTAIQGVGATVGTSADALRAEFNQSIQATNSSVTGLRTELKGDIGTVNGSVSALRTELKGDIGTTNGSISALRTELKGDLQNTNTSVTTLRNDFNASLGSTNTNVSGKCEIKVGAYVGNASSGTLAQLINLGRRPKAVLVWDERRRTMESSYAPLHGMGVEGHGGAGVEIVDQGFLAYFVADPQGLYYPNLNNQGITYMYIAFF